MSEPPFLLHGYTVERLTLTDRAQLQNLHERCTDYYQLIEGSPTRSTSAEEDLVEVPPGKSLADKFLFGIYDPNRRLIGALEFARDLPTESVWWLALLMLDPAVRERGLGSRVFQAAREWIFSCGGREIQLAVLEQNTRAERFWRNAGFQELRRTDFTAATGLLSRSIIMSHQIARSPRA